MELTIFAPNFKLTPAIRHHVEKRTRKLNKYFIRLFKKIKEDPGSEIRVKIEEVNIYHQKQKRGEKATTQEGKFEVELTLSLFGKKIMSNARGANLYWVIDQAYKKIKKEERQRKSRHRSLFKKGAQLWRNMQKRNPLKKK